MTTSSEPASKRSKAPARNEPPADPLSEAARRHFAIPYLYPVQRFVISNTLEQKSQIVVLPTGSGKSLCYQLPARIGAGLTIVVVPLLSLLEDQLRRCREAGLRADALRGGQIPEERRRALELARCGRMDLLFTTPETLDRLVRDRSLEGLRVFHLVVDEAHCVSEWGDSFRPAYLILGKAIGELGPGCLTAFTATAGPGVLDRIRELLFADRVASVLWADPDRPNIRYSVVPALSKARALLGLVAVSPRPLLVFSRTRSGAEQAARTLCRRLPHLPVRFYHAGLTRQERRSVERWYRESRDGVLTATSAYGMGVDKADIRTVIHLDIPYSPDAYLQETGRAGRDGTPVQATLLYSAEDLDFANTLGDGADTVAEAFADPIAAQRYCQILGYALNTKRCRREQLLRFLGQEPASCSGCDVCNGRVVGQAEGEAHILEVVSRHRRRFTMLQIVQLLRGAKSYEVVRRSLMAYYGFGLLSGWETEEIEEALDSLIRAGKIKVAKRGFWRERITTGEAFALKLRS